MQAGWQLPDKKPIQNARQGMAAALKISRLESSGAHARSCACVLGRSLG
jgi:hypothetical protein